MRVALLVVLSLAFVGLALAAVPEAVACTGDPSVCGVKRSAECTLQGGVGAVLRCWSWV